MFKTSTLVLALGFFMGFDNSFALEVTRLNQTPRFLSHANDLGSKDPEAPLRLRVWIRLRNVDFLNQYAEGILSGQNRKWLSQEEFNEKFAPTEKDIESVENYLSKRGLEVLENHESRYFVLAQGSVSEVQEAFKVQIHDFEFLRRVFYSNTIDPVIEGEATSLITMVSGLSNRSIKPHLVRSTDPETRIPFQATALSDSPASSHEINCFRSPETRTFRSADGTVIATYTGNRFGADITTKTHLPPCGYGPNELRKAYGFKDLNEAELDGQGQTVAIVDAFGSPTLREDFETFNHHFQLPSTSVDIYQPQGPPVRGPWNPIQQIWGTETSLDVEYSHMVAPAARIALVETAGDSDDQLLAGLQFAIENNLGKNISNSWGDVETLVTPTLIKQYDILLKSAAVKGISVNIASGDVGDTVLQLGYEDVNFPGSPFLTSIGGTTLGLNSDSTIKFETGWGLNYVRISDGVSTPEEGAAAQNPPLNPPVRTGFIAGSNGGPSRIYAKPFYQRNINGNSRMQPDISYLGDGLTGVEVVQTGFDKAGNPVGSPMISVVAGTSLACPMFSGLWAIANQFAGFPLGPAAPILYNLPPWAIRDILPVTSKDNVTGVIHSPNGTVALSSYALSLPLTSAPFLGTLFNGSASPYNWGVLTFGTDSTLPTTLGWDPVTGLGVPNGKRFLQAVKESLN